MTNSDLQGPQINSPEEPKNSPTGLFTLTSWGHVNFTFWQKVKNIVTNMLTTWGSTTYRHRDSNPQPLYDWTADGTTVVPVCFILDTHVEILLNIEETDYRSNFAKSILFENWSCFSKIPFIISVESPRIFQCLISIPAGHWVRQIDSDLPRRFFLSVLLSLVISMTGRSERSARALCDGADVVREAIGN